MADLRLTRLFSALALSLAASCSTSATFEGRDEAGLFPTGRVTFDFGESAVQEADPLDAGGGPFAYWTGQASGTTWLPFPDKPPDHGFVWVDVVDHVQGGPREDLVPIDTVVVAPEGGGVLSLSAPLEIGVDRDAAQDRRAVRDLEKPGLGGTGGLGGDPGRDPEPALPAPGR